MLLGIWLVPCQQVPQIPLGEVHQSMPTGLLGMPSMNVGKHHLAVPTRFSLQKKNIHFHCNLSSNMNKFKEE
jgi:hypothetical protein